MDIWRVILLVLLVVVLIPTVRLMNQVKALEEQGAKTKQEKEELAYKQKNLKLMQRVLVAVFLIALAATMVKVYLPLIQK